MSYRAFTKVLVPIASINVLFILGCTTLFENQASKPLNPVEITEWQVPWEQTRPRDPYVDQNNQVWFVGQQGDYLAVLNPEKGTFQKYDLDSGTGPQ